MSEKLIVKSGKRKTSIAKAYIKSGDGKISINNRDYKHLPKLNRLLIEEPIRLTEKHKKIDFDIRVTIKGGGIQSQLEAARLSIARAIVAFTKSEEIRREFLNYDRNLLVADVRKKEAYKPGDSKARAKRQSSKR